MELIYAIIAGIIGLFILGLVLLFPLKIRLKKELRTKSKEQLESEVFNYEKEYFSYIGENHVEVREFRSLIENHDLNGIKHKWKKLSKSFGSLERKAGHSGRPLILDYYCWYELALNELTKRNT